MKKYVLVEFPLSQYFDSDNCYICLDIDGAKFVPEEEYNEYLDTKTQGISDNLSKL